MIMFAKGVKFEVTLHATSLLKLRPKQSISAVNIPLRPVVSGIDRKTAENALFPFVIDKQLRKLLLQRTNLRQIANLDVRVIGILQGIVLVIILSTIEAL